MDSIYDGPRIGFAEEITNSVENYLRINNVVPEASMICTDKYSDEIPSSYNAWKKHNNIRIASNNDKENLYRNSTNQVIAKKRVSFDNYQPYRQDLNEKRPAPPTNMFEQFYMANASKKQFNIEKTPTEDCSVKTYTEWRHTHLTTDPSAKAIEMPKIPEEEATNRNPNPDWITDILNYNNRPVQSNPQLFNDHFQPQIQRQTHDKPIESNRPSNMEMQTYPTESSREKDEVTTKDLLKIIQQQNEQIILLQKQVAKLSDERMYLPAPPPTNHEPHKCFNGNGTPKKGPLSKFAIDLKATSFEVSFRPPQRILTGNPNVQRELFEGNSRELSLHLQNSFNVGDTCPSPEPSINIDMDHYDSANSDNEDDETHEADFYQNLMEQVNNMLKNETAANPNYSISSDSRFVSNQTMNRVKKATLDHLKNIGVDLVHTDDQMRNDNCNKSYSPKEVSMAVKQLLMKYLPNEQAAKLNNQTSRPKKELVSRRPEFSIATLEYMKKYNLLSDNVNSGRNSNDNVSKMLNIGALKMQPKLL